MKTSQRAVVLTCVLVLLVLFMGLYMYRQYAVYTVAIPIPSYNTTPPTQNSLTKPEQTQSQNQMQATRVWGTDKLPAKFQNKIAFLKNGEVWFSDYGGEGLEQITHTGGKVGSFRFSPSLKYIAYTKINRTTYLQGDNPDPSNPGGLRFDFTSLVIMTLVDGKIIKELQPSDIPDVGGEDALGLDRWVSNERLDFHTSDAGLTSLGPITYNVQRDVVNPESLFKTLGVTPKGEEYDFTFSDDGSLLAYSERSSWGPEGKMDLHVVDVIAKTDTLVLSEGLFFLGELSISHDNKFVAFRETEATASGKPDTSFVTTLWTLNLKDKSATKIYTASLEDTWGSDRDTRWSFDDRYIGMFEYINSPIFDLQGKEVGRIKGNNFSFTQDNGLIYADGQNIYRYNLSTKTSSLLIQNASSPYVF